MATPDLKAANQILRQKQEQARAARLAAGLPVDVAAQMPPVTGLGLMRPSMDLGQVLVNARRERGIQARPARDVAANDVATHFYRLAQEYLEAAAARAVVEETAVTSFVKGENGGNFTAVSSVTETVKAYPSLLSAFLSSDYASVGRVYLLIRALDGAGRGLIEVDQLRAQLTAAGPWQVMTWRRLRQIMGQGEGIFWERHDGGRLLRYLSPARIAQALDCGRLELQPVYLPVNSLLGGIQQVRANFYAAWHSARRPEEDASRPVTRAVVEVKTGVPKSTQIAYEKATGLETKANYAITGKPNQENKEAAGWERGQAFFVFTDHLGKRGKKGAHYVAWRMPNSFGAVHSKAPKGRQRKINRQMTDLVIQEARGNGRDVDRLYYPDGKTAAAACSKAEGEARYYRQRRAQQVPDQVRQFWEVIQHHV